MDEAKLIAGNNIKAKISVYHSKHRDMEMKKDSTKYFGIHVSERYVPITTLDTESNAILEKAYTDVINHYTSVIINLQHEFNNL